MVMVSLKRQQSADRIRWGAFDVEKFSAFAKELVSLRPDAIPSVWARSRPGFAVRETQTIG